MVDGRTEKTVICVKTKEGRQKTLAISKILSIRSCGAGYEGKHLKQALAYILAPEKTSKGGLVSALNCQKEQGYEQMWQTKELFDKTDGRQGYHLILSFVEGEVDADTAFEIVGRFAKEYLGKDYEALYAVHDNTAHIHGHIIFNSVSFRTGLKYHYKKGDWAAEIQPLTNRLCEAYGLATIALPDSRSRQVFLEEYREESRERTVNSRKHLKPEASAKNSMKTSVKEKDYSESFVWATKIRRDLDACIAQSASYEAFLFRLSEMGYELKNTSREEGKYLAVRPRGMTRFRRCKSLGEAYTEERIRERIQEHAQRKPLRQPDSLSETAPRLLRCQVKYYQRAKLSGLQKQYFRKLYQSGQLKKKSYHQTGKNRSELCKLKQLQEDYLFLTRHEIHSGTELTVLAETCQKEKQKATKEKWQLLQEQNRMKPLFVVVQELNELQEGENCYRRGEMLFEEEHHRWQELTDRLQREGYSIEQVAFLQEHYRSRLAEIRKREREAAKEERIAARIQKEVYSSGTGEKREMEQEKKQHKTGKQEEKKQKVEKTRKLAEEKRITTENRKMAKNKETEIGRKRQGR